MTNHITRAWATIIAFQKSSLARSILWVYFHPTASRPKIIRPHHTQAQLTTLLDANARLDCSDKAAYVSSHEPSEEDSVNQIIQALVKDFRRRQELFEDSDAEAFEKFATYCCLTQERLDQGDYKDCITDKGEEGIDAIAILVNGTLVVSPEDLTAILDRVSEISVKYVFVQAKGSDTWNGGETLKFTNAVSGFFNGKDIGSSAVVASNREIHGQIIDNAARLKENPHITAYYVGTGHAEDATATTKHLNYLKTELETMGIFSSIRCECVGQSLLQKFYKSATSSAAANLTFGLRVTLPAIPGVDQAFLGLLPASELMKLLTDEQSEELRPVFDDNVRDFQGVDAPVNAKMAATLKGSGRDRFAVMNNGITIVARNLQVTGDIFNISDYQIVNGAQTSNVLFLNQEHYEGPSVHIPTKIIQTNDEDVISDIVTATNSQTQIKAEQLNARAQAERDIEKYFASTEPPRNLLYERRSKQYANQNDVVKARVIDRYTLLRAVAAAFLEEPHIATGYPSLLTNRLASIDGTTEAGTRAKFLRDRDDPDVYYAAASAYYRLDLFFKNSRLEARFKPARWHLLHVARLICLPTEAPPFESRKFRNWVRPFINQVWDDDEGAALFLAATRVVENAGVTLRKDALRGSAVTTDLKEAVMSSR